MAEEMAKIGELELCYETFGDPADPALLLIMGLGTQMIGWPDGFCAQLAERGFFVIRFDNRDIGRSTHFRGHAPPTVTQLLRRDKSAAAYSLSDMAGDAAGLLTHLGIERAQLAERDFFVIRFDNRDIGRSTHFRGHAPPTVTQLLRRDKSAAAYSLSDMAGDAAGLLTHLGIERAHVAGASMGGMIAQTLAVEHPERVRSLASIMSNTGHLWRGTPGLRVYPIFLRKPADGPEGAIESVVSTFRLIGSPGFPFQEEELRTAAQRGYERGYNPAGSARQLAAILAAGDRTGELHRIAAPTVVIHGSKDRMIRPSGGRATAAAIPGARHVEIEGMGHDLPRGAWDRIVDAIADNAQREDASSRRSAAA